MEPSLTIPRQYQTGLAKIRALDDEALQELLSALENAPLTVSIGAMASNLASRIHAVPRSDVREIVTTLLSLHSLRNQLEASASGVAEYISRAMEESGLKELRLSSEERGRFKDRLIELLSLDSLDISGKAGNVLLEHEHILREARIVTDVRPVFGTNPSDPPAGAVIVHMLKIGYEDSGSYKNFFVALDAGDISEFRRLLERADKKAESLKQVLAAAKVSYVDSR